MTPLKFFIDTHDAANGTFPAGISPEAFAGFQARYAEVAAEEGVISLRIHVGFSAGRAFCLTLAPDAAAVARLHERMGLPYDAITEVATSAPGDLFFATAA